MFAGQRSIFRLFCFLSLLLTAPLGRTAPASSWKGVLHDAAGKPVPQATVILHASSGSFEIVAKTSATGEFALAGLTPGNYSVMVRFTGKEWTAANAIVVGDGAVLTASI